MLDRPVIVFLSGNNASGKTTLGKLLALRFGWRHLPTEKFDQTYLDDLFSFERRWSFEAQLHFLSHKIGTINSCLTDQKNAFIDRSPHEDAQVFAEHFAEMGNMDSRAITTYRQVAKQFLASIPSPDLFIYCYAPLGILEARVSGREREYEKHYPANHLSLLDMRYRNWLARTMQDFPGRVVCVNTSEHDYSQEESTFAQLANELIWYLEKRYIPQDPGSANQAPLFAPDQISMEIPISIPCGLTGASLITQPFMTTTNLLELPTAGLTRLPSRIPRSAREALSKRAYLAAPFTREASAPEVVSLPDSMSLPGIDMVETAPHGVIPDSYREELMRIEQIVNRSGFATTLPHRDVNKWGSRILTPKLAIQECTQEIRRSEVLIAIPDVSFGVHYEIGVAAGVGIPIVILCDEEINLTFLMKGIDSLPHAAIVSYRNLAELEVKLPATLARLESKH